MSVIAHGVVQLRDQIFHGEIAEQLVDERDIGAVDVADKVAKDKTVGRPKSRCTWKKGSSRTSNTKVSLLRKSWQQKVDARKTAQTLKVRLADLRQKQIDLKRKTRLRTQEK